MIEIERKFRLSPEQKGQIQKELQDRYGPLSTVHQVDEVFLLGADSFEGFAKGTPVVRLRTENGTTQLAYKRGINDAGDSIEHELTVSSGKVMRSILKEMDYRLVTSVDKVRLEAKAGGISYMLDSVKGAGDFLEIEVSAEDDHGLADVEKRIMDAAAVFNLTAADIETKKYDQLVT